MTTNSVLSPKKIKKVIQEISKDKDILTTLNAIVNPILLILPNRQIVFANINFFKTFNTTAKQTVGKYIGGALGCVNTLETNETCGNTKYCLYCGMQKGFENLKTKTRFYEECHILTKNSGKIDTIDILVQGKKIYIKNQPLILVNIIDIKSKIRRFTLRNYVMSKVIDSISAIKLSMEIASEKCDDDFLSQGLEEINRLIENLKKFKIIVFAEDKSLDKKVSFFSSFDVLKASINTILSYRSSWIERIKIVDQCEKINFWSDFSLIKIILENFLLNALEYSHDDVWCGIKKQGTNILFWVKNKGIINEETEAKLFKPIASEHGLLTGYGTYLAKLLGEGVLNGKVWLETNPENQDITFFLKLPESENHPELNE
ncbi:hypothetical protein SAMN04488516_10758 [Desulfonauticus submarinus]|uniref:Histidine kinase/HSP90-like ATPase domain-containing protein n=1 Tax=Desulfonauticus submarinus TaxID=206665 RepID=A0A1H0EC16_9BACT|nr:ATP-binding protein [Desulfonauticus submarinus]SDN80017.1 hypothetical protein SAMN04488516_10758 [Desulfonauticus submarinus]